MKQDEIIQTAIENLQKNVGIIAQWKKNGEKQLDGRMTIKVADQMLKFNAEIKQELRNYQLPQIIEQAMQFRPLIVIANHIFPKIKEELRQRKIAYVEATGNIYLQQNDIIIWVDTQKPVRIEKEKGNRAFTKTGLKVVFHFLLNENFINQPYREIARQTNVGLGNINNILNGLKELGFLIKLDQDQYRIINKKELLDKWIFAYNERLQRAITMGTFRFLKTEDFRNWRWIQFNNGKTMWGGEPAGDLLTGHLRPEELTMYTTETRNELIKNYRLIPDEKGNVRVYKMFWQVDEGEDNIVPHLLVYADLINARDKRCNETAQKIYERFIQKKL